MLIQRHSKTREDETYTGEKDEVRPDAQLTTDTQFRVEHDIVYAAIDQGYQL